MPSPHSSLGLGYIIGLRTTIPQEVTEQLSITGLTHIVAVSGYNLTILIQAMRRLFAKRSAYQSVIFSSLLLIGFLIVAVESASITRAAVVSSLSLLSWYYGREFKPLLLLLLSGVITGFANPLYVWGDAGWYLSFLAFAGILLLAPLVTKRYFHKKHPGTITQILIETLSAQVCTIPYTLYLFGGVSIIAPLANILVLPLIPLIMLLVFITGVIGMFMPAAAMYAGLLPTALLTLQLWLVDVLSLVPGARITFTISAITMIILFLGLLVMALFLKKRVSYDTKNKEAQQVASDIITVVESK